MIVAVLGTGTEVGKTWIGCALGAELVAAGHRVAARKPAQSFAPGEVTDAERLAAVTGETVTAVCPPQWSYPVAMAPPMAADVLGRPPIAARELAAFALAAADSKADITLVELAGGLCSPQSHDADGLGLLALLAPRLALLVAPAELGTLNAVQLSLRALRAERALGDMETVVVLNGYQPTDELHRRNLAWLRERADGEVLVGDAAGIRQLAGHLSKLITADGTG